MNYNALRLAYKEFEWNSLELRVYTDNSFASNDERYSQVEFIVLLCDNFNSYHTIDYLSKKSQRTARSIMKGEI